MKKLTILILALFSCYINAQYFKITPNGYNTGEENKGIEIYIPDRNKKEIYKALIDFINKNITNPEEEILPIKNQFYIRFTTKDEKVFKINNIIGQPSNIFGFTTYELEIEDDKIILHSINPELYKFDYENPLNLKDNYFSSIYNMKGEPRDLTLKYNLIENIEKYYNGFVTTMVDHVKNSDKLKFPTIYVK